MTPAEAPPPDRPFVRNGLPWVVAAAGLTLYLATLNHWMTLGSLPLTAKVAGWDWQPMMFQPLLFLATYPFRALPAQWVPLALNAFTAVGAALTLALLARSVALLPHDRLEPQRAVVGHPQGLLSQANAWVPPVFAVGVCGLQLSFWRNATSASAEMLDLLLFAYVIRCLLEYRLDRRQSWLSRAAFIFGLGMANSWALVGFLPLFVLALVWIKRLRFFRPRFLLRMALFGLAGLLLFLLLPLVQALADDTTVGFWRLLRSTAGAYKNVLVPLTTRFLSQDRDVALLLATISLFPVLFLSIRWGSFAGGDSATTLGLGTLVFHASHACLLLTCVWVAFDPAFSPSQMGRQLDLPWPFLPLYYLGALSVGYYSGYFLLMFGPGRARASRRSRTGRRWLRRWMPKLLYVFLGLALAGLVCKNAPAIRATNQPLLSQYGESAAQCLPSEGALVLSDDPIYLPVLQGTLARQGRAGRYVPVETRALPLAEYRAHLRNELPELSPQPGLAGLAPVRTAAALDAIQVNQMLAQLAQTHLLCYLQPGFGFVFEDFFLRQHGLVYEAVEYSHRQIGDPPLAPAELAESEAFWTRVVATNLPPLLDLLDPARTPAPGLRQRLLALAHLAMPPPPEVQALARWYSRALNFWGVELQRNDRPREATRWFTLALQLKPDNVPALVNLQFNTNVLVRGGALAGRIGPIEDRFGQYRNWDRILAENGPVDEPSFCFELGRAYAAAGMLRQAAQQFERLRVLAPHDLPARVMLAVVCNLRHMSDLALKLAAELRTDPALQPIGPTNEVAVAFVEATAWFAQTNSTQAEAVLQSLLEARPGDAAVFEQVVRACIDNQDYAYAQRLLDRRLARAPNDPSALLSRGLIFLRTDSPSNAIPLLTRALSVTNTPEAHLNRAVAYLRLGQLDAARADYQAVLESAPVARQAYAGLGAIALQKGDTNAAINYYQGYLSNSLASSEQSRLVEALLHELRGTLRNSTP